MCINTESRSQEEKVLLKDKHSAQFAKTFIDNFKTWWLNQASFQMLFSKLQSQSFIILNSKKKKQNLNAWEMNGYSDM